METLKEGKTVFLVPLWLDPWIQLEARFTLNDAQRNFLSQPSPLRSSTLRDGGGTAATFT